MVPSPKVNYKSSADDIVVDRMEEVMWTSSVLPLGKTNPSVRLFINPLFHFQIFAEHLKPVPEYPPSSVYPLHLDPLPAFLAQQLEIHPVGAPELKTRRRRRFPDLERNGSRRSGWPSEKSRTTSYTGLGIYLVLLHSQGTLYAKRKRCGDRIRVYHNIR